MSNFDIITRKLQDEFILLYAQKELHEISVKELCQRVGIARTAFYNYFADIYDVLGTIEEKLLHDLKEINQNVYMTNLKDRDTEERFWLKTLEYVAENAVWFRVLLNKSKDGRFIYNWKKIIKEDVLKKYRHDNIQVKNEALVMEVLASGTIGVFMYWVNNLSSISIKDVEEEALHRLYVDFR